MTTASESIQVAHCQCGALSATCRGTPWRVSLCHCNACKRRTGSAFGVQATFDAAQVTLTGEPVTYTRYGDEGHWGRMAFCGTCGTTLWWEIERRPGAVTIALGGFGGNPYGPPTHAVYGECAMSDVAAKIVPEPVQQ